MLDEIYPNSGGPAFPVLQTDDTVCLNYGMSLRHYFAAHAPEVPVMFEYRRTQQVVDKGAGEKRMEMVCESDLARIVRWRVQYADQMLAALAEK